MLSSHRAPARILVRVRSHELTTVPQPQARVVRIGGGVAAPTPLLLPSFSSRALTPGARTQRKNREAAERTVKLVVGPVLISAYDLHAGAFRGRRRSRDIPLLGPGLTFVDSGGYENFVRPDRKWTAERHAATLETWPSDVPAVMVGFDTPALDIRSQVDAAASILPARRVGRALLIKPIPGAGRSEPGGMLDLIKQLEWPVVSLEGIDVIGVTEKEAGSTLRERIETVMLLRRALDFRGSDIPIHLFGGLDPALTPLFFLAGADVFDGLSWLRYAFVGGEAQYMQPAAAWRHPNIDIAEAEWRIRRRNLSEINRMQTSMQRYLNDGDARHLHPRGDEFRARLEQWATERN